ncbi:MAG: RNA polymerase sigma factor (sigma-70 family) [Saprospiraceae bacterium]|jgi:RNA polymerase sigma factor (sigma-70 family)
MNKGFLTDKEIIEGIKAEGISREKALYHIFFQQDWKGLVIRYVLQQGGDQHDGDDVAQTAFISLERNVRLDKFKEQSALKTYFLSIARLQWLKKLRDRKSTDELKPELYEKSGDNIEDNYISDEKKRYFDKILDKVGERCKKIMLLKQLDHSLEEIAEKAGLSSAGMAKKESYRCRVRFRKLLDDNPNWIDLIRE